MCVRPRNIYAYVFVIFLLHEKKRIKNKNPSTLIVLYAYKITLTWSIRIMQLCIVQFVAQRRAFRGIRNRQLPWAINIWLSIYCMLIKYVKRITNVRNKFVCVFSSDCVNYHHDSLFYLYYRRTLQITCYEKEEVIWLSTRILHCCASSRLSHNFVLYNVNGF